jgi:acetolactate synthase-1/2/3 large subunit
MNVADTVARVLKEEGVEYLFTYPVNPLIEAAAKVDIRPIVVRQERVGLHMADAYSRMNSGEDIGVFCMQFGPGAENAFPGVAQAYGDSVPLVVLPMGYPRDMTDVDPNFNASHNYREVTKSAEQVTVPEEAPAAVRRAFNGARNGRPRPTLVEFPRDVFAAEIDEPADYSPTTARRTAPDPGAIPEVADVLAGAERPVIYAGQGVHYAKAWDELRELAELLEAPVTTSLQGKSAFPETHRLALGSGGRSLPKPVHHFVNEADVIFGIGCSFTETNYGISFPPEPIVVHATLDPTDIDKDVASEHALVGDAKLTLEAVIGEVEDRVQSPRGRAEDVAAEIESVEEEWRDEWRPKLTDDTTPLNPYRVITDLMETVDIEETIVTHDSGSPRDEMAPFWKSVEPLSYIGWGKSTQLGYGLGLAMGAKIARPEKLCINVWGDAAIGMTGMDFETAVREEIPILSVLFNNFSMAIEIPIMQTATDKYGSTDISGNYADMAEAFGGYGERVREPDDIVPAIERGIEKTEEGTPALLEFITEKENDYSTFD